MSNDYFVKWEVFKIWLLITFSTHCRIHMWLIKSTTCKVLTNLNRSPYQQGRKKSMLPEWTLIFVRVSTTNAYSDIILEPCVITLQNHSSIIILFWTFYKSTCFVIYVLFNSYIVIYLISEWHFSYSIGVILIRQSIMYQELPSC